MKRVRAPKSSQLELFSNRRRSKRSKPPQRVATMRKSSRVPHEVRPEARGALHVVLRIRRGLPGLRTPRALRRLERAFRKSKEKPGFALLHYSVQQEHLHLVVETESKESLALGMQGLEIRLAKALNALWRRRKGSVFADRYFALALKNIRQIWRTVRYVLSNGRKHGTWTKAGVPDPYSSGRWFLPWRRSDTCRPTRSSPVVEPHSYFCLPFLSIDDVPGPRWQQFTVSVSSLD